MSEINAPATLTTPGGTITFNPSPSTTEYYFFTDVQGLDSAGLRAPVDDKPQADGGIVHDALKTARHVTFTGLIVAISASSRNTMVSNLRVALESIEAGADGTYVWTETGQSARTLTVRCDVNLQTSGGQGLAPKNFTFGLVAANPAWS